MSCFLEKCAEEQQKIQQYAKVAIQVASEDGDDQAFFQKVSQNITPIYGKKRSHHPILGPLFLTMFPEADQKI